jgi:putative component of toxin-antitoxin plasmid stabilization module
MSFVVLTTDHFEKKVVKYKIPDVRIQKISNQLKESHYTGQPLGYPFLREKRLDGKRIYYLVYDDLKVVLLVSVSDKKMQQEVINQIKVSFPLYRKELQEYGRKDQARLRTLPAETSSRLFLKSSIISFSTFSNFLRRSYSSRGIVTISPVIVYHEVFCYINIMLFFEIISYQHSSRIPGVFLR